MALSGALKDHQKTGVAWLQHLWQSGQTYCSGCLVADDMGLGKTLQLLTFIAWYLQKPDAQPVLIVAPVSLLENWQREMEKFFSPGFAKVCAYALERSTTPRNAARRYSMASKAV